MILSFLLPMPPFSDHALESFFTCKQISLRPILHTVPCILHVEAYERLLGPPSSFDWVSASAQRPVSMHFIE